MVVLWRIHNWDIQQIRMEMRLWQGIVSGFHVALVVGYITSSDRNWNHSHCNMPTAQLSPSKNQELHGRLISDGIRTGIWISSHFLLRNKTGWYGIVLLLEKTSINCLVLSIHKCRLKLTHFCFRIHLMVHLDRRVFLLENRIMLEIGICFWGLHF